jgi:hypothetical protein
LLIHFNGILSPVSQKVVVIPPILVSFDSEIGLTEAFYGVLPGTPTILIKIFHGFPHPDKFQDGAISHSSQSSDK